MGSWQPHASSDRRWHYGPTHSCTLALEQGGASNKAEGSALFHRMEGGGGMGLLRMGEACTPFQRWQWPFSTSHRIPLPLGQAREGGGRPGGWGSLPQPAGYTGDSAAPQQGPREHRGSLRP